MRHSVLKCETLEDARAQLNQSLTYMKKLKVAGEHSAKELSSAQQARVSAEFKMLEGIRLQTKYHENLSDVVHILLYIAKKLDLISQQRVEDLKTLLKDYSMTNHMLDRLTELLDEANIPPKVDSLQLQIIEDRDKASKVTNFLYDLITQL